MMLLSYTQRWGMVPRFIFATYQASKRERAPLEMPSRTDEINKAFDDLLAKYPDGGFKCRTTETRK